MRFVLLLFVILHPTINASPLIRLETRDPSQQVRTQVEEQTQNTEEHAVISEIFRPTESPKVNKNAPAPDLAPVPVSTVKSQESQISTVILEADFKLDAEKRPVEMITEKLIKEVQSDPKDDDLPESLVAPCQPSVVEEFPDSSDEVKDGMKIRMRIIPGCISSEERFKETGKIDDTDGVQNHEKIMDSDMYIKKIQLEASTTAAPNQSDLGKKHIDITLNELEQPARVSLNNEFPVEEEELPPVPPVPFDDQKDLKEINDLDDDLGVELDNADCLDKAKASKFLSPPAANPSLYPRRLHLESDEDETEEDMLTKQQEFLVRVVVYFLSLLGDVVEDKPSTWQKIIAGVQCVLRDCREALPLRPTDRPLIGEGSFIIRRARESLCTCYIPGVTDVE